MAEKRTLIDLSSIDFGKTIADSAEIRRRNPQRFEMEQLTAIVYDDLEGKFCVGYKDITDNEFWVRGHMPGMPLMPGVVMLEAAAQLSGFFVQKHDLLKAELVGFGGLEDVRFRGTVVPGDRLVLICQLTKVRPRRMIICNFQGVVNESVVVEGVLKGIALPISELKDIRSQTTAS